MYGLVNKAIEDLICDKFGCETWVKIKKQAGVTVPAFVSMESYDDKITYDLVKAASEILPMQVHEILIAFGEYWVLYTAREGYKETFDLLGKTFIDFLQNLDMLHANVGSIMPELQPPSFSCTEVTSNSLKLHYHTHREGLTSMVIGLLAGLGKTFGLDLEVELIESRSQGADHDIFSVKW